MFKTDTTKLKTRTNVKILRASFTAPESLGLPVSIQNPATLIPRSPSEEALTVSNASQDLVPQATVTKKRIRVQCLDGMRLILQFWIIFGHYWKPSKHDIKTNHFKWLLCRFQLGPTYFIVLSGFVTYLSYRTKPLLEYYARRMIPMFVVNLVCIWFAVRDTDEITTANFWLSNFMLTSFYMARPRINIPLWTMSTLAGLWAVFPLCTYLLDSASLLKIKFSFPFLLAIITIAWSPLLFGLTRTISRAFPPIRLLDFVFGMMLAKVKEDGWLYNCSYSWLWYYIPDLSILALIVLCFTVPCEDYLFDKPFKCPCNGGFYRYMEGPISVFLFGLMIYGYCYQPAKSNKGFSRRLFSHPLVVALCSGGTIFCAYCLQEPVWGDLKNYPIIFFFILWILAVLVNDFVYIPTVKIVRSWFQKPKFEFLPYENIDPSSENITGNKK